MIRKLKKLDKTITYPKSMYNAYHKRSVLVFADALRTTDVGQLGVVTELLVCKIENHSINHMLLQISN